MKRIGYIVLGMLLLLCLGDRIRLQRFSKAP